MTKITKSGHRINKKFPTQRELTLNYSKLIRKIYDYDDISPRLQQRAIQMLPGITVKEMESILETTGPELAKAIRHLVSPHRATSRAIKDRQQRKLRKVS